jgi:hypothetical protein
VAELAVSIGGFALMSNDFDSLTSGFIPALVGAGGTVAGIVNLKIAGSKSNKAKAMITNQEVARLSPAFFFNNSPAYGFTLTVDF